MSSEIQKPQQPEVVPETEEQIVSTPPTENEANGFPRRSLLKGASVTATLGVLGGLALPAHALPVSAATIQTSTSTRRSSANSSTPNSFKFNLEGAPPQHFAGGTVRTATSADIEELSGLSISSEIIAPGAMHELHWHPNANELNYCLSGQGEVGIFFSGSENALFPIQPGSVSFVPIGSTHYIRNTGSADLHIITAFSHEDPEHLDFSDTLGFIPRNLLAQTFGLKTQDFPSLPRQGDQFLVRLGQVPMASPTSVGGPFTANFKDIPPGVSPGGTVTELSPKIIPTLAGMTLFFLQGQPGSLREPHWHQNASELHYCVQGTAQVEILAPNEHRESFVISPGEGSFVPQNYFHQIHSISDDPLVLLVFFSNTTVAHVDFSQVMGFFPRELLAASFGSNLHIFDNIPNVGDVSIAPKVQ